MSPGLGGDGIPGPGRKVGRIAETGGNGVTTNGMLLSGSTTRISETVGLMMFVCTQLNGIPLALKGANSRAGSPT